MADELSNTDSVLQGASNETLAALLAAMNNNLSTTNETLKAYNDAFRASIEAILKNTDSVNNNTKAQGKKDSSTSSSRSSTDDQLRRAVNDFSAQINKTAKLPSKSNSDAEIQGAVGRYNSALDRNTAATGQLAGYLKGNTVFGDIGKAITHNSFLSNKVIQPLSTRAAGLAGGVGTVGGALVGMGTAAALALAIKGLEAALRQAILVWKENLSYDVAASNLVNVRKAEAILGTDTSNKRSQMSMRDYDWYRNQMRLMGIRESKQIESLFQDMMQSGIAGGIGRSDAMHGAIGRSAVQSMYGIDPGMDLIQQLYRSTQQSRGQLLSVPGAGAFSVENLFERLRTMSTASNTGFGAQASMRELNEVVSKVAANFRGMHVNMEQLVPKLGVYANLISENMLTSREASSILNVAKTTSADQQLMMIAMAKGPSADLLWEHEKFLRRGAGEFGGPAENARIMAKAFNEAIKGASADRGSRYEFARAYLREIGQNDLANSGVDVIKLMQRISAGDTKAEKELADASKGSKDLLRDQVKKLDEIKEPTAHIRDMLYGYLADKKGAGNVQGWMVSGSQYFTKLAGDMLEAGDTARNIINPSMEEYRKGVGLTSGTTGGAKTDTQPSFADSTRESFAVLEGALNRTVAALDKNSDATQRNTNANGNAPVGVADN